MNRDGIAEPLFPSAPAAPGRGEADVWRIVLPTEGARAAARRALREILGSYLGEVAEEIEIRAGEHGKPALTGSRSISFNLSHSGGLAVVAIVAAGTEVGIDVERVRPRRDLVRLAERWLPAPDAEEISQADDAGREQLFYAAWTRHEARTKCAGTGLSGPPPGPDITAEGLPIDDGYAAAIAFDTPTSVRHRIDL